MRENTFITIQAWMRTKLNLSGSKLLVYAIIYGFSQDGESKFTGSRQYLADWCGCTVRSIQTVLNDLVEEGLILKTETFRNGVKCCEYAVNFTPSEKISPPSEKISPPPVKNFPTPSEKISLNNINNNITNNIDNNIEYKIPETSFLGSCKPKEDKPKKLSLYDKCVAEIYTYTNDEKLQECLLKYLAVRLAMKDKPIYGVNQWIGMLGKLKTMNNQIEVVKISTERGWASFFPNNTSNTGFAGKREVFSEYGTVKSEKGKDSEYYGDF